MAYSRRLVLFDEKEINLQDSSDQFSKLQAIGTNCTTYGRGHLWFGDSYGLVHRVDRGLHIVSFQAHDRCVHLMHQINKHDLLVTIGEDRSREINLKVWNLVKWTNKMTPFCCRVTSVNPSGLPLTHVTCMAVDEGLHYMVLGHANGVVQLFKGDITRERLCKRSVLYEFLCPVTGLGLYVPDNHHQQQQNKQQNNANSSDVSNINQCVDPIVFAASEQSLMSFVLGQREKIKYKTVLDRFGVRPHCTTMLLTDDVTGTSPQFAVACPDAVYFYNWDGRGPCLAADGEKIALETYKNYLIILKNTGKSLVNSYNPYLNLSHNNKDIGNSLSSSATITTTTTATGTTLSPPLPSSQSFNYITSGTIVIQDYNNKFVAGEFHFTYFKALFIEWNGIYLLCGNECFDRSTDDTLNIDASATMTSRLICLTEKDTKVKLDMLFAKKNFNLAIEIARSQHFDENELAHIIWRYADHLYKQKEYDAAIREYIKTIGKLEASFVIQRFLEGSHILQLTLYLEALRDQNLSISDHLILLLNCYCRLQDEDKIEQFVTPPICPILDIASALHVLKQSKYINAAVKLAENTGRYIDSIGLLIEDLNDGESALQLINRLDFDEALKSINEYGHQLISRCPEETIKLLDKLCAHRDACRINVQHLLKVFVNNPKGLMQFLSRYIGMAPPSKLVTGVADTFLELLLYEANRLMTDKSSTEDSTQLLQMAMQLLSNNELHYDEKKALVLCYQRQFYEGCIFLWEKQKLYDQMLRYYISQDMNEDIMAVCEKYGNQMPNLWLTALVYYARKPEHSDILKRVVNQVDSLNLASPLFVLQILSDSDPEHCCNIGTIRDYLLNHLEAGSNRINTMKDEVDRLRKETMRNREVVRKLNNQVKIFQQQKCVLCHQSLDPPSIHFLCDHSYHKACFDNYAYGDQQCPQCAPQNKILLAEIHNTLPISKSLSGNLKDPSDQLIIQLKNALDLVKDTSVSKGQHHSNSSSFVNNSSTTTSITTDSPLLSRALSNVLAYNSGLLSNRSKSVGSQNLKHESNVDEDVLSLDKQSTGSIKVSSSYKSPTLVRHSLPSQINVSSTNVKNSNIIGANHGSSTNPFQLESSISAGYFSSTDPVQSSLSVYKLSTPFDETRDDGNENVISQSSVTKPVYHGSHDVGFNESLTSQQKQLTDSKVQSSNPFDWD
ncbi:Vacuolar protein sorting-associated protein 11 like [Schistosoma japonicum]|nr:Vacuolar protein sorting-associated protein 11 like [Schistosoma japonicum]